MCWQRGKMDKRWTKTIWVKFEQSVCMRTGAGLVAIMTRGLVGNGQVLPPPASLISLERQTGNKYLWPPARYYDTLYTLYSLDSPEHNFFTRFCFKPENFFNGSGTHRPWQLLTYDYIKISFWKLTSFPAPVNSLPQEMSYNGNH